LRITVINGSQTPSPLDGYLAQLKMALENNGHAVTQLDLRDLDLRYCIGCFGCWVKTPGECLVRDESAQVRRAVIQSDFTLWAAPLRMGFPSALLKMALDKSIPLVHPYFVVDQGEAHHRPRYEHYPRLGLLVAPEPDTDALDLEIVANIFSRTALNLKSCLEFSLTTDLPVEEVVEQISERSNSFMPAKKGLPATQGEVIDPPSHLAIFNGSPRGHKGNTPIMLEQFGVGFSFVDGHTVELHHLNRLKERDLHLKAFSSADCVWLGFPLYTDSMPGMVKDFIEALVQSGFPEALHSRHVERYLQKLAARLGAPYMGTIVKGGGEALRMMPERASRTLFETLQTLGRCFAEQGQLDPALLPAVAGVERYPSYLGPVFKLFVRLPVASMYWDRQLKMNGVYDERFAQPYHDQEP